MTAQQLLDQQAWNYKSSGVNQLNVEVCPLCRNDSWKFYIGEESGLWDCKVCGETGNIYSLRQKLGLVGENTVSIKDVANKQTPVLPLPNLYAMHKKLIDDPAMADVLDYLIYERKLSVDVVEEMELGADNWQGDLWVIIPYFNESGNPVYFKGRSLPKEGSKKRYRAPAGREACLYHESIIKTGMEELVIVEGEMDCLSLMSMGYKSVVGVPGANIKKTTWIDKIDKASPTTVYLVYDSDKVGQDAAKQMAAKIGLDKTKNIVLPPFLKKDGTVGKDLNEWFCAGYTLEEFNDLKAQAKFFDVEGIHSIDEVLKELKDDIEGKGLEPTYDTPWPTLTKKIGGFEDGDLIGIMAEGKVGKTTTALNMLQYYAAKGINALMFCQEMPPKRMVRKWVSHVTGTDDTPGKSLITTEKIADALEIAKQMQGDILFGFTSSSKHDAVFETIKQAVRRYGVKIVCFDNLQMMVNSLEHFSQETSKITKQFKKLCMELNIVILLIVQPNRSPEGQIISARNAMGSSAIEKDVDIMMCLHRNRVVGKMQEKDFTGFIDTDETFEPNLLVKIDLGRYCAGGNCTLYMDGATSTVRELSAEVANSTPVEIVAQEV